MFVSIRFDEPFPPQDKVPSKQKEKYRQTDIFPSKILHYKYSNSETLPKENAKSIQRRIGCAQQYGQRAVTS